MQSRWKGAAVLAAAIVVAGCNALAPVQNVSSVSVAAQANRPLSDEQVRGAIVRAGAALAWVMKDTGPGQLGGMQNPNRSINAQLAAS
jgi:hypothetical protein